MNIGRNDMCWCGSAKKYKLCHMPVEERIRTYKRLGYQVPNKRMMKTVAQLEGIKESGKLSIAVLDYIAENVQCGMSTESINKLVHDKTLELGGIPAPLGFEGFPKSVCTSINNEVCHGIPSDKVILKDGDIINVDVSTNYKGYYSDASRMFCIGSVSLERKRLVEVARKAIDIGLMQVKAFNFLGDMGQAIHDYVLGEGYSVVKEIGGHGIGLEFHEEPYVSYVSKKGSEMLLVPGVVFTIEPMINLGTPEFTVDPINGWTVYTKDGKSSAQWEVTVAVTEEGYQILAY